jgi:hypothetical protein
MSGWFPCHAIHISGEAVTQKQVKIPMGIGLRVTVFGKGLPDPINPCVIVHAGSDELKPYPTLYPSRVR